MSKLFDWWQQSQGSLPLTNETRIILILPLDRAKLVIIVGYPLLLWWVLQYEIGAWGGIVVKALHY